MKILIAEDDEVSRRLLAKSLTGWGHEVVITENGTEAWSILQREDAPRLQEDLASVLDRLLYADQIIEPASQESMEAPAPVDLQRLSQAMGDEPDELHEILDIYLAQMARNLKELDIAITTGDRRSVELIAHNSGGASANCGMTAVVASLRELETMGRDNQLVGADALAATAGREFERIKSFLQEHLQPALV